MDNSTHTEAAPAAHAPDILATRLGYAGLMPFIGLALLAWVVHAELVDFVATALALYGALIASFLGGIHWALAARVSPAQRRLHYLWGVSPSLLAWVAALMPPYAGLPLLALILVICYLVDRKTYPDAQWSAWLPMRLRLTVVAALSCLIGAAAA
jgi:hypothetical protein